MIEDLSQYLALEIRRGHDSEAPADHLEAPWSRMTPLEQTRARQFLVAFAQNIRLRPLIVPAGAFDSMDLSAFAKLQDQVSTAHHDCTPGCSGPVRVWTTGGSCRDCGFHTYVLRLDPERPRTAR